VGVTLLSDYSAQAARRTSFADARTEHIVRVCLHRFDDVEAVAALGADIIAALGKTAPGAVIFADHRRASPLSSQAASAWSRDMRRVNPSIARSGLLLDPSNAVFNLQLERVVQCAGNDARRIFTDPEELYLWLAESLNEDEKTALRAMLPLR
jgi:hypothetical protein